MPVYIYQNKLTKEIREVIQTMNESHVYKGTNGDEEWDRVFYAPNSSVDIKLDPFSQRNFLEKTAKNKGNLGDIYDLSKELSDKRAISQGVDPVKQKYYENYSKKRKGVPHPDLIKGKSLSFP